VLGIFITRKNPPSSVGLEPATLGIDYNEKYIEESENTN
jgi:hypothetical protein